MHHKYAVPMEAEEGIRSSGTKVAHGCELSSGCWESKLGPLQELQVFLNC